MHVRGDVRVTELERANRRAERERRARLAAEEIAERATRELYDTVRHLREAEARARIVGETAVEVFTAPLALSATLGGIVASAERALDARRVTCFRCAVGGAAVEDVHGAGVDSALAGLIGRPPSAIPGMDGAGADAGVVALRLSHASILDGGREAVLGVLVVEMREARPLTAAELLVARSLAALASMALANARLHEQILRSLADAERRAATDPLTGLANHRAFQERLTAEVRGAPSATAAPLALAVIDLDHFKRVNDVPRPPGGRPRAARGRRGSSRAGARRRPGRPHGRRGVRVAHARDRRRGGVAGGRAGARGDRGAHAFPGVGRVTISAGVCDLPRRRRRRAAVRAGRRRPLLGEAPRPGRGGPLLARGGGRALGAEERADPPRAAPGAPEHPGARPRGGREGPAPRAATPTASPASPWPSRPPSAGRAADRAACTRRRSCTTSARSGCPTRCCSSPAALTRRRARRGRSATPRSARTSWPTCSTPSRWRWVRGHHERWAGGGYPDGLAGDAIPDGARVIAVADAWDVMTSDRPYRDPVARSRRSRSAAATRGTPVRPPGGRRPRAPAPRRAPSSRSPRPPPRSPPAAARRAATRAPPGRAHARTGCRGGSMVRVRSTPGSSRRRTSRRSMAGGSPTRTFRIRSLVPALDQHASTSGIVRTARTISPRLPGRLDGDEAGEAEPDRGGAHPRPVAGDHPAALQLADAVVDRGRRELHRPADRRERHASVMHEELKDLLVDRRP